MVDHRYARQILAFGEEGQRKIESVQVAIVGLGGIGSQVAQGLAYLGVKAFVLVDDDVVSKSNLNRLVGGLPADAEAAALKTAVTQRLIKQVEPDAVVRSVSKNLRTREAIEALIECPVIFGCLDHDGPRLVLMELAAAYDLILIDAATEINVDGAQVTEFGGRVVVSRPGDFCLDCASQIDMDVARQELDSPEAAEVRQAHGYGLGERGESPAVVSLNGVIANLAITEFLAMTTGLREPYRHLVYYGLRGKVNVRDDRRRADCYTCGYLVGQRENANIFRYLLPKGRQEDSRNSHGIDGNSG